MYSLYSRRSFHFRKLCFVIIFCTEKQSRTCINPAYNLDLKHLKKNIFISARCIQVKSRLQKITLLVCETERMESNFPIKTTRVKVSVPLKKHWERIRLDSNLKSHDLVKGSFKISIPHFFFAFFKSSYFFMVFPLKADSQRQSVDILLNW